MATNDAIHSFDGSVGTIITGSAPLAQGNFSPDGDSAVVDFSAAGDRWIAGKAVLAAACAADPTDQGPVDLFYVEQDIDGAGQHMTAPSGTAQNGGRYLGSFKVNSASLQYDSIPVSLWGVRKLKLSVRNQADQSLNAGYTVKFEGFTAVPRP